MVILHDEEYYRSRVPQPDLGPYRNFLRFVWNKERKTFLDRTAKEWGQLGMFYLIFFSVLGSIFALQMKISVDYVSKLDKPFYQYADMPLKTLMGKRFAIFRSPWQLDSPGIVFKPSSMSATSPIISVNNASANTRPKRYIQALDEFLQEYHRDKSNYNLNCQNKSIRVSHFWKPCYFDIKKLGACSKPPYGYTTPLQPCVLIKFNKRFDWVPECYNRSSNLPMNMPDDLKKIVQKSDKPYVWLSCDGANNVDKEHIGRIEYIPRPGFSVEYFPFAGQPDYLSPLVALRFMNLTPYRLVTVECNLWAFNIRHKTRYSLDFQILIV